MMRLRSFAFALGLAFTSILAAQADELSLPTLHSPRPSVEFGTADHPLQARFGVRPAQHFNRVEAQVQSAVSGTVPLWTRKIIAGGNPYTYEMVGKNPFVTQAVPTTTIKAVVVPVQLIFTAFSNYTTDPEAVDATCSPAGTAARLTKGSPIFQSITGSVWNSSVGSGQYVDLFQRANYYTQTNPSGINPDYHVTLTYATTGEVQVPVSGGNVVPGTCGNVAMMDYDTWDNYVQTVLMPFLAGQSPQVSPPNTLTIFLLYNTVLVDSSGCCILGYHSAFNDPSYRNTFHTYVTVEFDTNRSFTGVADISTMSHEVAEWMDDPAGNNPAPSWGNVGQVSGCQANLEVADPLSGTLSQIYMPANKYTYHVQDLAFTSWFYDQHVSTGVNGWYSFLGNFLTPAAPC